MKKSEELELYKTMIARILPASLLIKKFVRGEQECNYEIYLLELLNNSTWFKEHYPGKFVKPNSESNGECDANNDNYQLDFKMFAASTALRAKNLCEPQITKMLEGVVLYGGSKKPNASFEATRIFAVFRDKSIDELNQLRLCTIKEHSIENDISTALKVLETKKNILLFFPYIFTFDIAHEFADAVDSIIKGINSDFQTAFKYREINAVGYDTFLTCIYQEQFLIFQIEACKMYLRDIVVADELPTYVKLREYATMF